MLAIGPRSGKLVAHRGHVSALALEIIGDAPPQRWIGDVMRRIGGGRHVAAGDLVPALPARLTARELVRDGIVDSLVIAQLEMQERVMLDRAPMAAEQCLRAD